MSSLLRTLRFQPDFHFGPQFAGVSVALKNNLYRNAGIRLEVLPLGSAGEFASETRLVHENNNDLEAPLTVATTEQNILIPAMRSHNFRLKAVAAMFGTSPLGLVTLPEVTSLDRIGVHEDTVDFTRRLFPDATTIIPIPREDKIELLTSGQVDAVQAYDVMEVLELERLLGAAPNFVRFDGHAGAQLGYSQVVFAPADRLASSADRKLLRDFLDVTFEGWHLARLDPRAAAAATLEFDVNTALFASNTLDMHEDSVRRCLDYVRRARCSGKVGAIDGRRWARACEWLGGSGGRPCLDSTLYAPDPLLVDGDSMAAEIQRTTRKISDSLGTTPKLTVVTVGTGAEGHTSTGAKLRENAAPSGQSWFNKKAAGETFGVEVDQIDLPQDTSTRALLRVLREAARKNDGIQLMWPLPSHIDSVAAYNAIPAAKDVDGAHYIGRSELCESARKGGKSGDFRPVTPDAVLEVLRSQGVSFENTNALVIGRSRILGSPLAHALLTANASVTVAHSCSRDLEKQVRAADVIVSCAGVPGLIKGEWIKIGAGVVSVGTTFDAAAGKLVSDLDGNLDDFKHAKFVATAPGGVGPLSLAILMRNVVEAARRSGGVAAVGADASEPAVRPEAAKAAVGEGWTVGPETLEKVFHVEGHIEAAEILRVAGKIGDGMKHHVASAKIEHRCEEGVDVTLKLFTTSTGSITKFDLALANQLEHAIAGEGSETTQNLEPPLDGEEAVVSIPDRHTAEFLYDLPEDRIAIYPKERGGSRLLVHVPETVAPGLEGFGRDVSEGAGDRDFTDIVDVLPGYAHLVFNESRVFEARVRTTDDVEVLFLSSLEGDSLQESADGQMWKAMVRNTVEPGTLLDIRGGLRLLVEEVLGDWIEEGENDGVEAAVRVMGEQRSLQSVLGDIGEIPLPPYLNRPAEEEDEINYQTVYAKEVGSVAAPTAGLHFTENILTRLSEKGVKQGKVCLHVGAGTFKPMQDGLVGAHDMHSEEFSVGMEDLDGLLASAIKGNPIVAIGTTSARVLESLYWLEVGGWREGGLGQWDAYKDSSVARVDVVAQLRERAMQNGGRLHGITRLCITPGYDFKMIDAAVTNFHAPDSTLMMLVAALVGDTEEIKGVYEHAVRSNYRFLSYGDSSLLLRGAGERK